MDAVADDRLLEGQRALETAEWDAARAAFESVFDAEESPDPRDGLAQALWFLGRIDEAIAGRERAFDDFVRASCS